ncbi:MAG: ABC-2 type transport system permease protein [Candidatus Azotimanducaceae bacterium]|jgi:ABC-2 type transport system permease protein
MNAGARTYRRTTCAHKLQDKRYYEQNIMGPGNSFIDIEATVSTLLDQAAIAPGYLQREWIEGERHVFIIK